MEEQNTPVRSGYETAFAWLSLLAGYLFIRVMPSFEKPLAAALFIVGIFAVTTAILRAMGRRFDGMSIACLVTAGLAALSILLVSDELLRLSSYLLAMLAYCCFVLYATNNGVRSGFSPYIYTDFFKALVVYPFGSFGKLFGHLGSLRKTSSGKLVFRILLGLLLAAVPVVVIVSLLSYDAGFEQLIRELVRFENFDFGTEAMRLLFTIPVAMYIYGLFSSSVTGRFADRYTEEQCLEKAQSRHVLSPVTVISAAAPIAAVYVLYFISQWSYYVSAFTGVLPEGLSYAEYCRDGFFQLCAVAALNFALMLGITHYMKNNTDASISLCRVLCLVFSALTLVLIATALSKMLLYIKNYGLTTSRIYATWFMLVLTVLFVFVIVKQFVPKFRLAPWSAALVVSMYLVLSLVGVNRLAAGYNVDRYIDGSLRQIDILTLYELGDEAVPELVRLQDHVCAQKGIDPASVTPAKNIYDDSFSLESRIAAILQSTSLRRQERTIWEKNIAAFLAERASKS